MKSSGLTLIETLIATSIMGVVLAILLPAVHSARNASRKLSCSNNAHQILLALHNFESVKGTLPAGTCLWNSKTPYRSWFSQLLPYMEQTSIGREIDIAYQHSANPFDVVEHQHLKTRLPVFLCPEDGRIHDLTIAGRSGLLVGLSSFQGNLGRDWETKDGLLFGGSKLRLSEITDGLAHTYAFGERPPSAAFDYGWWYAGVGAGDGSLDHTLGSRETAKSRFATCGQGSRHFRFDRLDDECATMHYWSLHSGGANFGFADGSVRFLTYDADQLLPAFSTRHGSESIPQ